MYICIYVYQGCYCPPLPPNFVLQKKVEDKVEDKSGGIGGKVEEFENILKNCLFAYDVDIYVKLKHFECRLNHSIIVFF